MVIDPSVNAAATAPIPWHVTSTDVAVSVPPNTLVAICDTKAMNGDPMATTAIITASIRRIAGVVRANRTPSPSAANTGRRSPLPCGRRTSDTARIAARKLTALTQSATSMPPIAMAIAAIAGPMMRPRFHCAFDNPTAATRCSRGTRSGNDTWNDGKPNMITAPPTNPRTARPSGVACPPPTHTARNAASNPAIVFVTISTRRRRRRSAIADPMGPTIAPGMKPAALTIADHDALPVVSAT